MPDEIVDIENCAKSYLMNARECYDKKDYQRALSYLEAAKDEIELLARHNKENHETINRSIP